MNHFDRQLPVFVYGTLRPGGGLYHAVLEEVTIDERPAILRGAAMYAAGSFPYVVLNTTDAHDDIVHGDLLSVRPDRWDETLGALDYLEGFSTGSGTRNHYTRRAVTIDTGDGWCSAWVYVVDAHRVRHLPRVTSGDWFDRFPQPNEKITTNRETT